jgi:hypothetical protein
MFIEFQDSLINANNFTFDKKIHSPFEVDYYAIIAHPLYEFMVPLRERFATIEACDERWQQLKLILDIPIVLALKEQEEYDWKKHV